ncbi:YqhV family protein [Bacillus massilinigeriensis]|uniref:YqhV family protein n=1 Tax=Bacillus mediterraneensis TaxID=1805474 RepID=UPI0008F8E272|nr:YqhV family protein [Bacillus mediterraneensis]
MFNLIEKAVLGMAFLRLLSGTIEVMAAFLMLKLNDVGKAMIVNGSLAFVGPVILILTTTIGLLGLADKIAFAKLFWVLLGVGCILYGVKSN